MFWRRKKTKSLPFPEGPYVTGCVDLMDGFSEESLFIRLLYPTDASHDYFKKNTHRWVPWIPEERYIEAFALLLSLWVFVLKFILWIFGKNTKIPTLWEERASTSVKKFPVLIFSHGYGATRFLCMTVCNEFASRGYLVACIEHKDLSASITYYYDSEENRDNDKRTYLLHKPFAVEEKEHYALRNRQMKYRSLECSRTLDLLRKINDGTFKNTMKSDFDVQSLKDKIDLTAPAIMGHSFGGATSIYTLTRDERFKLGVILDGWMFPLKNESNLNIPHPLLFINSQTFHIEANIKLMKQFTSQSQNCIHTIRNTTHESHTDTPIVFGYWLNIFMKKLPSPTALKVQNYLILDFFHKHAGLDINENRIRQYLSFQSVNVVKDYILHTTKSMKKFSVF